MTPPFKPDGYNSVSPYLVVTDASATIEFLKKAFDGHLLRHYADGDGRVLHAEVRIEDSVVMLADAAPNWPAIPAHVHIYVEDVDETYLRALRAGAVSVQEPVKKDDADKRGGIKDDGGTTWWIGTQVA